MMNLLERERFFSLMNRYTRASMAPAETLETIASDLPKKYQEKLITAGKKCGQGHSLYESLKEAGILEHKYLVIIREGEKAGQLDTSFAELRLMCKAFEKEIQKANKKLAVPVAYVVASILIFLGFLLFIFPVYGKDVKPKDKNFLFHMSDYMVRVIDNNPIHVFVALTALVLGLIYCIKSRAVKAFVMDLLLQTPQIKDVVCGFMLSLWARYVSISLNAGMSIDEATKSTAEIMPRKIQDGLLEMLKDVRRLSWNGAFERKLWRDDDPRHLWPKDFCASIKVGGISGNLGDAAYDISDSLLEYSLEQMARMMSVIDGLGKVLVGLVICALFFSLMMVQMAGLNAQ